MILYVRVRFCICVKCNKQAIKFWLKKSVLLKTLPSVYLVVTVHRSVISVEFPDSYIACNLLVFIFCDENSSSGSFVSRSPNLANYSHEVVQVQWHQQEEVVGAFISKHKAELVFPRWHTGDYKCWHQRFSIHRLLSMKGGWIRNNWTWWL